MPIRPNPVVLDLEAYPLGEHTIPGVARPIVLASNECAVRPSGRALAAYRAEARNLTRYPDRLVAPVTAALARRHGIDGSRIVLANGSEELIALLCRTFAGPGTEVLLGRHGYLFFDHAARAAGARPVRAPMPGLAFDVDALLAHAGPRTRLVFVANPNNPTGSVLSAAEVVRLREGLPGDALLVLDAAYAEYVTAAGYDPGTRLAGTREDVVMLRTFSKVYGLAGARLGWAYGSAVVASALQRMRNPSGASAPALAAGLAAIDDAAHVARVCAVNARRRAWFARRLAALGLEPYPTEGNFVLIRFPAGHDAASAHAFLKERGILVRPMAGYGLADCLRITIGTGAEMRAVTAALALFLGRND